MLCLAVIVSICAISITVYEPVAEPTTNSDEVVASSNCCENFLSLMKSICGYPMIIYYLNTVLWNSCFGTIMVFHYDHVSGVLNTTNNAGEIIPDTKSAGLAMTMVGTGQLVITIIISLLHARFSINKLLIQLIASFTLAAESMLLGFAFDRIHIMIISFLYGISGGLLVSNVASLTYHFQGDKNHNVAYGFARMASGVGSLTGPPIAAAIRRSLGFSIYFTGAVTSLLCFCWLLVNLLCRRSIWLPASKQAKEPNPEVVDIDDIPSDLSSIDLKSSSPTVYTVKMTPP